MSTSSLRRRILSGLAGVALAASGAVLTAMPAQAASVTGYTTASSLTVRAGTSTSTAALTTINGTGTKITVQCQTKGQAINGTYNSDWWAKVTVNGKTGYVSRAYVRIPDATGLGTCSPSTGGVAGYTTTSSLTVRAGTSTSTAALTTINGTGTKITVQCQTKGQAINGTYSSDWWAKVTVNGKTGYVSRAYVRIPNATGLGTCSSPAPTPTPSGERPIYKTVHSRAMNWINRGVPYSMYAWTWAPQGGNYRTDCSGFVSMVFNLGESRSTVNMLSSKFRVIPFNQLQKGDIVGNFGPGSAGANGHVVVFNGWANSSHTAFYTLEMTGGTGASQRTRYTSEWWVQTAAQYVG